MVPEGATSAVIVLSDGLTGMPNAQRIASILVKKQMAALSVYLWGRKGLPIWPDRIPADRIGMGVRVLLAHGFERIALYGAGFGSCFALEAAARLNAVQRCVLVSPLWSACEGIKRGGVMSGHSMMRFAGEELPYVRVDLQHLGGALLLPKQRSLLFLEFARAWSDTAVLEATNQQPERLLKNGKDLLMIAGEQDRIWPSAQVVKLYRRQAEALGVEGRLQTLLLPASGHILGIGSCPETGRFMKSQVYEEHLESQSTALSFLALTEKLKTRG